MSPLLFRLRLFLLSALAIGFLSGSAAFFLSEKSLSETIFFLTLLFGSIPLIATVLASFAKRALGIDIIAITAVCGSAALGEYAVGTVILLMLSTGEMLEDWAFARARREIGALLSRAPDKARRKAGSKIEEISVEKVRVGDLLLVRPGDIVPVNGIVEEGESFLDESMLTGESVPVEKRRFTRVMSGSVNQGGGILTIRAEETAQNSQYERIVRLVREAESNEVPMVRMADRYSARFTVLTGVFGALAWWLSSGDWTRVLAVLVVATPCPLILATPIAFASGISRGAKRGIIIKNGGSIEQIAEARSFVFDKTGTLTIGTPSVQFIDTHTLSKQALLTIAASLEQFSTHIIARSILSFAKKEKTELLLPDSFEETLGKGVRGTLRGQRYFLGSLSYLEGFGIAISREIALRHETSKDMGVMIVYLATKEGIVGDIHLIDTIRKNTRRVFQTLKSQGVRKTTMLTGDKEKVAAHIAKQAGITDYRFGCLPEDKIREIRRLKKEFPPVIMVGDGVNDAPSLIEASAGIALGSHGTSAATEAGDVVITGGGLEKVEEAFLLSKKVLSVAKSGMFFGIGSSVVLMIFASVGLIPPILGAVLQEGIDVLAILNALRVHRG